MNTFRCPKCGLLNFAGATICKRCKTEFSQEVSDFAASANNENSAGNFNNLSTGNAVGSFTEELNQPQEIGPPPYISHNQPHRQHRETPPLSNQNFQPPQYTSAPPFSSAPFSQNAGKSDEGKKTGMAMASLVLGVIGFFTLGLLGIGAIVGVILGGMALQRANRNPHEYGGKGLSIAGITLNCLSFVSVFFIGIIAAIAIPNLLAARRAANEGSAIATMRALMQAESSFMESNTVNRCGDLTDLLGARLIDTNLAGGEKSGYKYVIAKNAGGSCELFAAPLVSSGAGKTGTRSFYVSTNEWEIRAADKNGAQAGKNDPMLRMFEPLNGPQRIGSSQND
ncbi:MAG: DUF4190 domain-containing protein [Pyrinomonadaceae bacterium]